MLLRFGFSNYYSIRDYQEFSLVASSLKEPQADVVLQRHGRISILPAIGLYGANASGKSNVLIALRHFRTMIRDSHARSSTKRPVVRRPFLLDPRCAKKPSRFDADFIVDAIRYHYGFEMSDGQILEEWLYSYPKNQRQIWYHRKEGDNPRFHFGKLLRGKNKTIEALMRDNSLFLSTAAANNHRQLSQIHKYFSDGYIFRSGSDVFSNPIPKDALPDQKQIQQVVSFLKLADTGIVDMKLEELRVPDDARSVISELESVFARFQITAADEGRAGDALSGSKTARLAHASSDGSPVLLELGDESRGTLRLLDLLNPIFEVLEEGRLLVVDELASGLHPLLARRIVQLFTSRKTNPIGAQLIFATHDTNLLRGPILRRDQVWFTEKDNVGATHVYPLTDIHTRQSDNLAKGYLEGRFGAIPFVGGLDELTEEIEPSDGQAKKKIPARKTTHPKKRSPSASREDRRRV